MLCLKLQDADMKPKHWTFCPFVSSPPRCP